MSVPIMAKSGTPRIKKSFVLADRLELACWFCMPRLLRYSCVGVRWNMLAVEISIWSDDAMCVVGCKWSWMLAVQATVARSS